MLQKDDKYYFAPTKIIRDLVHGYVNLTPFDLDIIDSGSFQRLKDIRQLTCQHVYPGARHTRFEHSLGVRELTKRAIRYINRNGIIGKEQKELIINKQLEFNTLIAALMHDVGHCPFSHMGEAEFDKADVQIVLCSLIDKLLSNNFDTALRKKLGDSNANGIGATHELLSCAAILKHYFKSLSEVDFYVENEQVKVDFELIFRCILGIEYDLYTWDDYENKKIRNVLIRLINHKIFDMDKLDYIMRDSFFTGIGMPEIDTQRLFRNMFLNENGYIVFTSKAVPALQNMIESRDGLYMYVYNHHAVIYTDFLYSYIFRKLDRNQPESLPHEEVPNIEPGILPVEYFFSPDSVLDFQFSDSDIIANLNVQYFHSLNMISTHLPPPKITNTLSLIRQFRERKFLKPWWKTVFELTSFMHRYFPDDDVRKNVGKYICGRGKYGLDSSEFRSQIAKHVIEVTKTVFSEQKEKFLLEHLEEGDFFVVERSNRFFAPDIIDKIEIYLKKNEMIGPPTDIIYATQDYYAKYLTNIIPQKNYSSIYAEEGFYIFAKPLNEEYNNIAEVNKHYEILEKIFAFVATELVRMGEQQFVALFQTKKMKILSEDEWKQSYEILVQEKEKIRHNEVDSQKRLANKFIALKIV